MIIVNHISYLRVSNGDVALSMGSKAKRLKATALGEVPGIRTQKEREP